MKWDSREVKQTSYKVMQQYFVNINVSYFDLVASIAVVFLSMTPNLEVKKLTFILSQEYVY